MQADNIRSVTPSGVRDVASDGPLQPHPDAEGVALLAALPLAAAIVGVTSKGVLKLIQRNSQFDAVIAQTGDEAMMSGDFRNCIHLQIAQLMTSFLADAAASSEL